MSADHAMDLSPGSQGFFSTSLKEIIKTATYWTVYNHHNNCLVNNIDFDLDSCTYILKNSSLYTQIPFMTVVYIEDRKYATVSPYQLFHIDIFYNGESCILNAYYKILKTDFHHFLFKSSDFNKVDYFGTELDFDFQIQRLSIYHPLEFLTKKEWVIAWMIIQNFSNSEIANYLKLKTDTIKKKIETILGAAKLSLFHRGLFIEVAKYLGWDLLIPVFFIKDNYCINKHPRNGY